MGPAFAAPSRWHLGRAGSGVAANITVHSCGGSRGFDRVPFLASACAEEPRKRKATHGLRMGQCFGFFGIGGISVAAGVAAGGFALTASHLFQTPECRPSEKVTQKALPRRTALRLGSVFPRYGVHPGASPPVCFAAPPLDVCGFAAWRCAPNPRMNTYARPAEGAEDQKPKPKPKQIKRSQPSAAPTREWVYSVRDWSAVRPAPTVWIAYSPMRRSRPTQHNER